MQKLLLSPAPLTAFSCQTWFGSRGAKGGVGELGSWGVGGPYEHIGPKMHSRGTLRPCEVLGEGLDSLEKRLFLSPYQSCKPSSKLGSLQLMHRN